MAGITSLADHGAGIDALLANPGNLTARASDAFRQSGAHATLVNQLSQHHSELLGAKHFRAFQDTTNEITKLLPDFLRVVAPEQMRAYWKDAGERWILYLDTLRERGNSNIQRDADGHTPVLAFDYDMVIDGRAMERPVNYALVRINPPDYCPPTRRDARPYVIIDPRAGHGSGIGGFKAESEVGIALQDGHPVYFVIFFPEPEPRQTLADICKAEARFLEEIHARHPGSPPALVVGNCQGGWATMILSATHPGLTGPVVIAGAPLSYWAGEIGKNPFRYLAGMGGGAVPILLACDLGGGKFDGAVLVSNFETLNPGRTWFRKYYDLFSKVDTDAVQFLEFERWWSGFYFMNENEIRWILENLFIGNRLTRGQAMLPDGTPIDLTRITAPVIVFASHGDNITPPQQALDWIADLHENEAEIRARGHVIIYTLHDSIGHLGIFVSAKVAQKQHREINSVVKTIEALSPGLYELMIEETAEGFEVSFENRRIADILALGGDREEEEEFAAVAKLSDWATQTYELTLRPMIRAMVTPELARAMVAYHPIRQRSLVFSDRNPAMANVARIAADVRARRAPEGPGNPFIRLERLQADLVEQSWDMVRDWRDAMIEIGFHALYNTPWMRAIAAEAPGQRVEHDASLFPEVRDALARIEAGDYKAAIIRMLLLLAQARGSVRRDRLERSNRMLHSRAPFDTMKAEDRARLIHEQNMIVQFAPEEALATLPKLLGDDVDRMRAVDLVMEISGPVAEMDAATIEMFKRIQAVLRVVPRHWHEAGPAETPPRALPTGG